MIYLKPLRNTTYICILMIVFSLVIGCSERPFGKLKINCEECYITKQETAMKIAEAILTETYGKDKIDSEKPFKVKIINDSLWNIEGSFNHIGYGGVFNITLSAKNGKVIEMYHGK